MKTVEQPIELKEAMRNDLQEEQLDRLIDVLGSQRFADFYADNGMFGKWITGSFDGEKPGAETRMRERLLQLFKKVIKE